MVGFQKGSAGNSGHAANHTVGGGSAAVPPPQDVHAQLDSAPGSGAQSLEHPCTSLTLPSSVL